MALYDRPQWRRHTVDPERRKAVSMPATEQDLPAWLAEHHHPAGWANFLTGLPEHIIEPVCTIAATTHTHPALALGVVAAYTSDPQIKRVAAEHLARHDPAPDPGPNRAARRAADRQRRRR